MRVVIKMLWILTLLQVSFHHAVAQTSLDSLIMFSEGSIPADKSQIDEIGTWIYKHYRTYPEITEKIAYKLIEASKKANYPLGEATGWRRIGASNYVMGKTSEVIRSQFEALQIYEEMGDSQGMAFCYNNIGLAQLQVDEQEKALDNFRLAEQTIAPDDRGFKAICYNNMSLAYSDLEKYDSALLYNNLALAIRLELDDKRRIQATYMNLGVLYYKNFKNLDKGKEYLQESVDINHEIRNYSDLASGYVNLGNVAELEENVDLALTYFERAVVYADSSNDLQTKSAAYLNLSQLESAVGNAYGSLEYFKSYHDTRLEAIEAQQKVEVGRLETSFEVLQKEKELAELREEQASQRLVQLLLIIGIIVTIVVGIMITYILRLRIRNAKLAEEELQIKLEHKNKELTSYALNFIQKNELMAELSDQIETVKRKSDPGISKELNKINRMMNDGARIDSEWENFKMMFEEVHSDFLSKLKEQFPEITNSELKLCALLRLNLNLKESSRILGISADSVKTARYRLRKKLGLSGEENLIDFLIRFERKMVA